MPNGVKYSTTTPSGSLRRDNVALGVTGNLGPTSNTGFYSMPTPASGKYIINKVAASGVPNFFAPQNDTELIQFARNEGATGADTGSAAAVLSWIATQANLEAANFEYEGIVTDGLVLNLDAGFVGSYPTINTTWYDLSGNASNGTLINGPTFNSANSGSIVFDGSNDLINGPNNVTWFSNSSFTIESWFKFNSSPPTEQLWFSGNQSPPGLIQQDIHLRVMSGTGLRFGFYGDDLDASNVVSHSNWYQVICSYDYSTDNSKIFVNGSQVATGSMGPYTPIDANVGIGYWRGRNVQYFKGNIAITRVYNRVLSQTEITQNYNAQKGRFGL
jgi:hypothetical protein